MTDYHPAITLLLPFLQRHSTFLPIIATFKNLTISLKAMSLDCDKLTRINERLPALALPTEVACVIFKMASNLPPPFRTTNSLPIYPHYVRMEVNISHVCRLWRSMSLTYPELWSTFVHDDMWIPKISISCLATYLQRSRNRLVDFYFRLGSEKREDWIETVECIAEHVLRWRRLSLRINRAWPAGYLFAFLEHLTPPNLEMLEICTPHFDCEFPRSEAHPSFRNGAPKLHNIRMDSRTFKLCAPLTWGNMTIVNLQVEHKVDGYYTRCHSWASFIDLLRSPHLMHLSLVGAIFDQPYSYNLNKPTIASNLVNFRCSDDTVAIYMWQLIRAPRLKLLILKTLPLSDVRFPSADSVIHDDLGSGIFPLLSTLVLINCNPGRSMRDANYLFRFAKLTASVTRLVVVQLRELGVMRSLLYQTSDVTHWPRLESLIFYYHDIEREFKGRVRDNSYEYMAMAERRSQNLKKPFKLGLHKNQANRWRSKDSKSWARFNKAGCFLGSFTKEDQKEVIPWPALEHAQFDISSEDHFLLS